MQLSNNFRKFTVHVVHAWDGQYEKYPKVIVLRFNSIPSKSKLQHSIDILEKIIPKKGMYQIPDYQMLNSTRY